LGEVDYEAFVSVLGIGERMPRLLIPERARKALYKDGGLQRWVSRVLQLRKYLYI
jgi:hypothetical protein